MTCLAVGMQSYLAKRHGLRGIGTAGWECLRDPGAPLPTDPFCGPNVVLNQRAYDAAALHKGVDGLDAAVGSGASSWGGPLGLLHIDLRGDAMCAAHASTQ
jgi:hypothetical protein